MLDGTYVLLLYLSVVAFAAFVEGFTGLGFGIIVMAGIAFTSCDLERFTLVLTLLLMFLNSTIIWAGRKESKIEWRTAGLILVGEALGVPIGYGFILHFGKQPVFRFALGIVLILFAINHIFRPQIKKALNNSLGILIGLISGFIAGAFAAAGPLIALFVYSRHRDAVGAKLTLQVLFFSASICRLISILIWGEGITMNILKLTGIGIPIVFIFAVIGHFVTRRVSHGVFLKIVFISIGLSGFVNVLRALREYGLLM